MVTTAIYRYVDSKATLIELMVDEAIADPLRVTLLLYSLIRTYASLSSSMANGSPPAWLGDAIVERFPLLGGASEQDTSDAHAELDFAVDAVLRGIR